MILAIDAVGTKHGGGAAVLLEILARSLEHDAVDHVYLACTPKRDRSFELPVHRCLHLDEQPAAERSASARFVWQTRELQRWARRRRADSILCLNGGGITRDDPPGAVFVQQALPFCDEAMRKLSLVESVRMHMVRGVTIHSCRRARRVIVQSPTMAHWIATAAGIPTDSIDVFPPSVPPLPDGELDPVLRALLRSAAGVRLLYVGNDSPYKNLAVLTAALEQLRATAGNIALFGTWSIEHPGVVHPAAVALGFIERHQMRQVYKLATALVVPSFVETVALPLLEAMSVGTPVVVADRPYAHDTCRGAAWYFDPGDAADLARQVRALIADESTRRARIELGRAICRQREHDRPYEKMIDAMVVMARSRPRVGAQ